MSLPRQAMQQMGFSICCLLCDAPDIEGSKRCKSCIASHKKVRDRISGDVSTPIEQLAKDLMAFTTEPHRHDHDPIHGPFLKEAGRLLAAHRGQKPPPTEQEIAQAFEIAKKNSKRNIIREVANSVIKEGDVDSAIKMVDSFPLRNDMPGARTIPSKIIPETDRSDRPGEDREFMDRFKAEEEIRKSGKELSEPNVEEIIGIRKAKRKELDNILTDVDELINEEKE